MGYDQYTVLDTVAVESTFVAFLWQSQAYVHGLSCHSFKYFWRAVNSQPPIIPFGVVACTFSDNLSRNSCIRFKTWHDELAWGNRRNFASLLVPAKRRLRWNEPRNSILMTCHYPDLGSASDWSCSEGTLLQPIRSTIQIWVVTRHQYGISSFVSWVNQR